VDTVILANLAGCDSLVVTTTTLVPLSETLLTATSCNPNLVGIDTVWLSNFHGCDSLVITEVAFAGFEFEASVQDELCFGEKNGRIHMETVPTIHLPVELVLENHSTQFYSGNPLLWQDLPPGIYTLSATNSEGCTTVREVEIAEAAELQLELGHQSLTLHAGDSIRVEPSANFPMTTAEWSPPVGVQCPACPGTWLSAPKSATYTLTASDANGCTASAALVVVVDERVRIFVPNALRPGSGSPNDRLTIFTGPEVAEIRSLQLFDRWGNQLFEQENFAPNVPVDWDGTFRGRLVPQGVVVWMLTATTTDGRVVKLSGDIVVLR
jgi:hypothetical protein